MKKYFNLRNIVLSLIIVSISFGSSLLAYKPKTAHATGLAVWQTLNTSPSEIMNTTKNMMDKVKSWVLDGLAWHIAKMFVQRITASVVQWINSGFSGSPSFLTNPGGFFADIGDQVTGSFIANTGILSGLCSPFNIDVRLSIALGQAGYGQVEKYTCTLSTVIRNAKNTTVNGASIEGFMKGDYRQGGFPAFVEINLPTNNASGVYLKAQSDLNARIASKQGQKHEQLAQGSGFLSWDSCKNVTQEQAAVSVGNSGNGSDIDKFNAFEDDASKGITPTLMAQKNSYNTGEGTSIQSQIDPKSGQIQYQDCHTETPGSVIGGQLNSMLPKGAEALNLADSINEIVSALIGQLVNQVLQSGLGSVSSKSSGVTQSYIQQLSDEANASSTYNQDAASIASGYAPYIENKSKEVDLRKQAVTAFDMPVYDYGLARTCYATLLQTNPAYPANYSTNKATAESALVSIAADIAQMNADKKSYDDKLDTAQNALDEMKTQAKAASTVSKADDLQAASEALQRFAQNESPILDTGGLESNVEVAKGIAGTYDKKALQYQNSCQTLKAAW